MPQRLKEHQNEHKYVDYFGFEKAVANVKKKKKSHLPLIFALFYTFSRGKTESSKKKKKTEGKKECKALAGEKTLVRISKCLYSNTTFEK